MDKQNVHKYKINILVEDKFLPHLKAEGLFVLKSVRIFAIKKIRKPVYLHKCFKCIRNITSPRLYLIRAM